MNYELHKINSFKISHFFFQCFIYICMVTHYIVCKCNNLKKEVALYYLCFYHLSFISLFEHDLINSRLALD